MILTVDRTALVEALAKVAGAIITRSPKPVLSCVHLEATTDTLYIAATDLEISLRVSTGKLEVKEQGKAVIPFDKLSQIVRESSDPTITLEVENTVATIRTKDSKYKVFGFKPEDYPAITAPGGDSVFTISSEVLNRMITQTAFATAKQNTRYAINGALMERDGAKLTFVATDGHRLAVSKGTAMKAGGDNTRAGTIIPAKAMGLIKRLFDDDEALIKVQVESNQVVFFDDGMSLTTNIVNGNFPPYRDVIPKDNNIKAVIDTQAMTSATRRAALLTSDESKGVRLSFTQEGVVVTSRAPEMGDAEIKLPLVSLEGEHVEIGFNPTFMLNGLKAVETDTITLHLKAANKPGVIVADNFTYVIMPVNLD